MGTVVFTMQNFWNPYICIFKRNPIVSIDLVTVFDAILTSRQTCEKLQRFYENLMSHNFSRTAVLKKNMICKLKLHSRGFS